MFPLWRVRDGSSYAFNALHVQYVDLLRFLWKTSKDPPVKTKSNRIVHFTSLTLFSILTYHHSLTHLFPSLTGYWLKSQCFTLHLSTLLNYASPTYLHVTVGTCQVCLPAAICILKVVSAIYKAHSGGLPKQSVSYYFNHQTEKLWSLVESLVFGGILERCTCPVDLPTPPNLNSDCLQCSDQSPHLQIVKSSHLKRWDTRDGRNSTKKSNKTSSSQRKGYKC